MDENIKKKISQALLGRKLSESIKNKISISMRGVKKSDKHKFNISMAMKRYYNNKKGGNYERK